MFSQFGRTFRSRCMQWFHIEAHCFTLESITWLGSHPMLSPARFAFACVFRSASQTLRVYTNELGDPRSEPGNWNVRIKLAARPSIVAPFPLIYRSTPLLPFVPFFLSLSPFTAILFACSRNKRFRAEHTHRSLDF